MATQTISVSAFQTLCAEIADAINSGDSATAYKKYGMAEAVNAALDLVAEHNGSRLQRRESLAGVASAIKLAQSSASGATDNKRLIRTRVVL